MMKPKKFDKITVHKSGLITGITRYTEVPAEAYYLAEANQMWSKSAQWKVFKAKRSNRKMTLRYMRTLNRKSER